MAVASLSAERIKGELLRLRRWAALAHPTALLELSPEVRALLNPGDGEGPQDAAELMTGLTRVIERLSPPERHCAQADFNLLPEHSYATLTQRQESLASELRCATKTVRRRSSRALDTMALIISSGGDVRPAPTLPASGPAGRAHGHPGPADTWRQEIASFWKLSPNARVDIVCSEIPEGERPYFASPADRNYLRYARFGDLDSLIYVRTRLVQAFPTLTIRDFAPSELAEAESDALVVIGGPAWNVKCREFLLQLPFSFEAHPLGEDDPLVVPQIDHLRLSPRWTAENQLLEDLAVVTRLTLRQGTTVFLLAGSLTLGVLAASKLFLEREQGAANARYLARVAGDQDVVVVTEARRLGGITDTVDLHAVPPLLVLARSSGAAFTTVVDNTSRYMRQ